MSIVLLDILAKIFYNGWKKSGNCAIKKIEWYCGHRKIREGCARDFFLPALWKGLL